MPDLLVVGDSLAFHGPERPCPADEPRLWPNIAAARLGGRAEIVARAGWTARHAWSAITGDPRVWAALPRVGAVVLGVSGMDSLPSPLPTALRELIPVLRPAPLRHAARSAYRRAQPRLAPALARLPGGDRRPCRPASPPPTWNAAAPGCTRCAPGCRWWRWHRRCTAPPTTAWPTRTAPPPTPRSTAGRPAPRR
ncbi:SGNH/GDSL hydrolase family protein [Pseudonocardia alni]|nr:SGNH/GDSL hydrolase family protein [Pseudonocardia alni]